MKSSELYILCKFQAFVGNYYKWVIVAKEMFQDNAERIAFCMNSSTYTGDNEKYMAIPTSEFEHIKNVKYAEVDITLKEEHEAFSS